jgi:hypothetical protein
LAELHITETLHPSLFNFVTDFYANVPSGTPMWFMVMFEEDTPVSSIYTTNKKLLKNLLRATNNLATACFVQTPLGSVVYQDEYKTLVENAAAFRAEYLTSDNAPVIHAINYQHYSWVVPLLPITTAMGVCGYVGMKDSVDLTPSFGLLAARYVKNSVQRNIGAVADGPIKSTTEQYHGEVPVESMQKTQSIYDANYICLRVHNGRSGYYFTDDRMFMPATSDYKSLTAVRTIDKAYRIAFDFMANLLLSELGVKTDGSLRGDVAKDIEARICTRIKKEMTDLGQLNADPTDPNDFGVVCSVDTAYNTMGNSRLKLNYLRVKPFAYARYIDVPLGFVPVQ